MVRCRLCGRKFRIITNSHLSFVHGQTLKDYTRKFGTKGCGFLSPNLLPKNDPRYIRWKKSLEKRPAPWNKGYTKNSHVSVAKISKTFKEKRIDNFAVWRKKAIKSGLLKINHPALKRCGDLAELIGVVLGDGYIGEFPRTQVLQIFSNANNPGFVKRYSALIKRVFGKEPARAAHGPNCIKIGFYQKDISKRLGIPSGARKDKKIEIPGWIFKNKKYLKRYLRGLYEAEGSFCVHKPTCTYKFIFSNRNESLLKNVYKSLEILGFHPHSSKYKIQISRREEVYRIKELIKFRQY